MSKSERKGQRMERDPLYKAKTKIGEATPRKGPLFVLMAALIFGLTIAIILALHEPMLPAGAKDRRAQDDGPRRMQIGRAGEATGRLRVGAHTATLKTAIPETNSNDQPRRGEEHAQEWHARAEHEGEEHEEED